MMSGWCLEGIVVVNTLSCLNLYAMIRTAHHRLIIVVVDYHGLIFKLGNAML